jgi:hypothetical protein
MKFRAIVLLYVSFLILFRCGNSPENSPETDPCINLSLNGLFAQGADTLKVVAMSDNFGKTIGFDLNATREESVIHLFNEAILVDKSSKMEHYRLKNWITGDSSFVAYQLLDFTYSFNNKNWTLTDTIIVTDHEATLPNFTALGGVYESVQ